MAGAPAAGLAVAPGVAGSGSALIGAPAYCRAVTSRLMVRTLTSNVSASLAQVGPPAGFDPWEAWTGANQIPEETRYDARTIVNTAGRRPC